MVGHLPPTSGEGEVGTIMPKTEVAQAPAKQVMDSGKESGLGVRKLGLFQFRWVTQGRYFPFSSRISREKNRARGLQQAVHAG